MVISGQKFFKAARYRYVVPIFIITEHAVLQLFHYFPTEVVQIDSEWPILAVLQLFQYFPTKVVWIYSEQLILAILQLFQ